MKKMTTPNTELTAVKPNPEMKKKNMSPLWQSVLVGGVPGILIGAGGTVGAEALANTASPEEIEDIKEEIEMSSATVIQEAHSVSDDMSFGEAFAAARSEVGPGGAFVWHGQVYGTYRGDDPEWQEMSAEDRAEHSQTILSQVHASPYTPTDHEPEIVPFPQNEDNADAIASSDDTEDDIDVHIVGVGTLEAPDGSIAQVGVGTVDDHAAIFADTDGDDLVDTVLIDTNDNAQLDRGEVFDATDAGITIDDLCDAVEPIVEDVMDDTPDMNDGMGPMLMA